MCLWWLMARCVSNDSGFEAEADYDAPLSDDDAVDGDIRAADGGDSAVWLTAAEVALFAGEFDVASADIAAALRKLLERKTPNEDAKPAPAGSPFRHAHRGPPVSRSRHDLMGRRMQAALRERLALIKASCFRSPAVLEFLEVTSHLASKDRTNLLHWAHKHGHADLQRWLPKCE